MSHQRSRCFNLGLKEDAFWMLCNIFGSSSCSRFCHFCFSAESSRIWFLKYVGPVNVYLIIHFPECLPQVLWSSASQPGMILFPRRHLATSAAIFGCYGLWGGTRWWPFLGWGQGCRKARWPALSDKDLSGPNIICAEVENPCFKATVSHSGLSTSACCVMRVY